MGIPYLTNETEYTELGPEFKNFQIRAGDFLPFVKQIDMIGGVKKFIARSDIKAKYHISLQSDFKKSQNKKKSIGIWTVLVEKTYPSTNTWISLRNAAAKPSTPTQTATQSMVARSDCNTVWKSVKNTWKRVSRR